MAAATRAALILAFGLGMAAHAGAQSLPLSRAIEMALADHPDAQVAAAAEHEARERAALARSGWFPRITLQEGWQRGNEPVFAFGSLLSQRRFTEANFAIASLNQPAALSDYRAALTVRQPLFDPAATTAAVRMARAGSALAGAARRRTAGEIAVDVADWYGRALIADATVRAASAAIDTATASRASAAARRDAGVITDADVLAIEVHLARMRSRAVDARADAQIARATLNRLIGVLPDAVWTLTEPAAIDATPPADAGALQTAALRARGDVAAAASAVDLARADAFGARAALLPKVSFDGGWAWNGGTWADRASSWVMGIRAELSISAGGGEAAAARAAARRTDQARARLAGTEAAARLDVQSAMARLESARARREIGAATVAQARESERIIRDRYDAGLATTTDVLRAAEALLDAETLAIQGRVDAVTAGIALDRALGRIVPPAATTQEAAR